MAQEGVCEHHLGHSDRAAPADVISDPNFELAVLPLPHSGHKQLYLHYVVLKKWAEVTPVAEPKQSPKLCLEVILDRLYLLIVVLYFVLVSEAELVVKQKDGQLVWPLDFNLLCPKKTFEHLPESEKAAIVAVLLRCSPEVVPRIKGLPFKEVRIVFLFNYLHKLRFLS